LENFFSFPYLCTAAILSLNAAAQTSSADAQNNLSVLYAREADEPKDKIKVVEWTAEQGFTATQFTLGNWYTNGHGAEGRARKVGVSEPQRHQS
jgi:TPR repeat protein